MIRESINPLSPISIVGIIEPCEQLYKLIDGEGIEHLIVSSSRVDNVLRLYCGKEVKIIGLQNKSDGTLIPQKVLPSDPSSKVIDLSLWKNKKFKRSVLNKINEFVVIPLAVLAVLAS